MTDLSIVVCSYWMTDRFVPSLSFGGDRRVILTRATAFKYAAAIQAACAAAEYDAAVVAQLTSKLGATTEQAAGLLKQFRDGRPKLRAKDALPLHLDPGVSLFNRQPFLKVRVSNRSETGQWDMRTARQHATDVLEVLQIAPLDNAYYRFLTEKVGLDPARASQAVADLATHRADMDPGTTP